MMFKQTCTHLAKLPKSDVVQWLKGIESIICDADGVLWHFDNAIDGAVDTFNLLRAKGKRTFVVTNSSSMLTTDLLKKATKLGIELKEGEMISSALAVANFLKAKNFQKKALVVGEVGVIHELTKVGICGNVNMPKKGPNEPMIDFAKNMKIDPDVGAVIVSKDDEFTVAKIVVASTYLQNPRILFIGTCQDAAYPVGKGRLIVGAAAMLAAIKAISGRKPLILGKPNPSIVGELAKNGLIKPEKTLMIGDTLQTDILLAHNCGFQSLFVGSGVNNLKQVKEIQESGDKKKLVLVPDTYLPSIADLQQFLCADGDNTDNSKK